MPCSVPVLLLADVNGICNVFLECLYFLKKGQAMGFVYQKAALFFSLGNSLNQLV